MRLWGVASWPDVEADYRLWGDCGIFAIIIGDGFTDLHMAMRKGGRRHCRTAVSAIVDMLRKSGHGEIRAMIEVRYRQVCNLAIKMGFHHCGMIVGRRLDGTITEAIEMRMKL
jgi:hypothetical protein